MTEENNEVKEPEVPVTSANSAVNTNAEVNSVKCIMNKCQRNTIYVVGSILLVLGLLVTGFWWHLYSTLVKKQLPLSNSSDSQTFEIWTKETVPLLFSIYMFNWTNADASVTYSAKPKLQQLGPYVYKLDVSRKNFIWNSNDTITYLTKQRFYFVPELSKGNPDTDIVTSPNVILLSLLPHVAKVPLFLKVLLDKTLSQYKINLFVKQTASELLFNGYNDKLLDLLKPFKNHIPALKMLPDRFAWYLPKNRTQADIFNIYTGQTDLTKLGLLYARNYSTHDKAFNGACGQIGGSPGDFWPIDVTEHENASLYISDFCSSFELRKADQHIINDIDGVKFVGQETTFDNGSHYPHNRCYCPTNVCKLKSGVRNVTTCVQAPVFLSFPHFYLADPSYINAVKGLKPNKDEHEFHMTFQKNFGVLLHGAARLQINVHLQPIPDFNMFEKVPNVILPTLWFEESINLPVSVLDKLHKSFTTIPMIFTIVGLVLVVLGSIILVTGVILTRMTYQNIPYVNERL